MNSQSWDTIVTLTLTAILVAATVSAIVAVAGLLATYLAVDSSVGYFLSALFAVIATLSVQSALLFFSKDPL